MAGKPSRVKQWEIRRIIGAAKQAGAERVEVRLGDAIVIISPGDAKPHGSAPVESNAWLEGDGCNNSFDKIMRDK